MLFECEMQNCHGLCFDSHVARADGNGYCCDCPPPPPKCFPSDSKVYLKNGEQRAMSELQIGDQVQASIKIFFFTKLLNIERLTEQKPFISLNSFLKLYH